MSKHAVLYLALAGLALSADKLSNEERNFVMEAYKGGHTEVHLGQLGIERGTGSALKVFAQRLVQDHTKANQELMTLAKDKGVNLPSHPSAHVPKTLSNKYGAEFDKEFGKVLVEDHEKDIAAFEKEASAGSDPDLKAWAAKTLPALREHLEEAKKLDGKW